MRLLTGITVFLTLGTVIDAKITQPNSMDYVEGKDVNLPCNHSTIGGTDYVHWYRQNLNQRPQYVIHSLRNNVTNNMASLIITEDRKSSTLILPRVTLRDSAVYYCALRDTVGQMGLHLCNISLAKEGGGGSSYSEQIYSHLGEPESNMKGGK